MGNFKDSRNCMLPYEKSEAYGFETLTDEELLAIIIRSGSKNCNCIEAAGEVINLTKGAGIIGLQRLSITQLSQVKGIGKVKATMLKSICELSRRMVKQSRPDRPVFKDSHDVAEYLMEDMRHQNVEKLILLTLDSKCKLISQNTLSVGTVNQTFISAREVLRQALLFDATFFILIHNHPSGDPTPSSEDILSTKRILEASRIIGINMIDHIIIGDNTYVSLKDSNLLNEQ